LKKIDEKIKAQIQECIKFAEESPYPEAEELYEDVYAEENYPFIKD
jgi:pyruvate dehydrogenase E1 component alpha subunit